MKHLLYVAVLFALVRPSFAEEPKNPQAESQPPESSTPAELLKLRQEYIASLNALIQQYVKDSNSAGAALVTQEIQKVSPPAAPVAPALATGASPVGVWAWHHNATTNAINADGTVGRNHTAGSWHWVDQANRKLEIDWASGYIDKAAISAEGKTMRVVNNLGEEFTVRLIPPTNVHETPESPKP